MKARVLFLCTRNSARSQMAEAFLRKYGGDRFEAYSAGLEPKDLNPSTVRVMEEIGVPITGQYSKGVREYVGKLYFSYLITVCSRAEQQCPTAFPGVGQRLHWELDDPAGFQGTDAEKLAKFREVRDQIEQRVQEWLKELR